MRIEIEPDGYQPPKHGLILLQCLAAALFFLFVTRFWYLQILQGENFARMASENRLRKELIYAPRGIITDRNGVLLAENRPEFGLGLIREECWDINATLAQVSLWTGIPVARLKAKYQHDRAKVKQFEPIILASDIPFEELAVVEANLYQWPGLSIITRTRRNYPYGKDFAHVLGYVSEANESELEKDKNLSLGDIVGKAGLELILEQNLRGKKGLMQVEVDSRGRELQRRQAKAPQNGDAVTLSIDYKLQEAAISALGDNAGCVVVMDPDTGKILALATLPAYDNNTFAGGLSVKEWDQLRTNPRFPMQNRVIQSTYPPGSVWKILMAGLLLQEGVNPRETVFCPGAIKYGNQTFRCWRRGGHGSVNMTRALVESCDVYFYQMGERMGIDRIEKYALACGFGQQTGIDLPHERSGLVPSKEWKRSRRKQPWLNGETLNVSIGQGFTLVTPVQVARFISGLLNGGRLLKPNLFLDEEPTLQGWLPTTLKQRLFLSEAMRLTVAGAGATARVLNRSDAIIGGKTGTAQVVRIVGDVRLKAHQMAYEHRDHAWMASWAIQGDKKYVIVVMVEHGGGGSSVAGPVVKKLYEHIFGPDNGPPAELADSDAARQILHDIILESEKKQPMPPAPALKKQTGKTNSEPAHG